MRIAWVALLVVGMACSGPTLSDELLVVDPETGDVVGEIERDGRFDRRRSRQRDQALEDIAEALEDLNPDNRPLHAPRTEPAPINRDMPVIQLGPKCRPDGSCWMCAEGSCGWFTHEGNIYDDPP